MDIPTGIPEFGTKREHEERRDGTCAVVFDPETGLYGVGVRSADGLCLLFSGGKDADEDIQECALREVREESGLHDFLRVEKIGEALAHYHNRAKNVNRVAFATCFLVILKSRDLIPTKLEEHEQFSLAWLSAEAVTKNWEGENVDHGLDHWIYFFDTARARVREVGHQESGA